ncbi:hypothetical protein R1sor_012526 [Riccia sorocarpa]|uniref:Uncharacterized protein n=1 Tax=Riccia sorocarpa TaxID=122646 RepID=A0ABD3I7T1_9MARC
MPAELMVKAETKTLDILKSGRKWEVSLYLLFLTVMIALLGGRKAYPMFHAHFAEVKEFALVRELNLKALQERMLCSVDMRSLPPSQFGDSDDLQIVGIPTMRLQKKKYLDSLHQELSDKTCAFIRSFKQDWTYLWDYTSNKCWIFSPKGTRGETTCHNQTLVTVAIDVPRGDDALQMLCKINMALCIRLRPWDGIFLEHFAQALLVMPWAMDILNTLVEKQLVTVWRT